MIHQVQQGDNIFRLGLKYKVSIADLKTWNHLKSDNISIGQILRVSESEPEVNPVPITSMPLRDAQDLFTINVALLINFIHAQGFKISFGETFRSEYQQKEYVRTGYSKTMDSKHIQRLAIDFNFFKDGRLLCKEKSRHDEDYALLKPIGDYWVSLNPKHQWGGFWDDSFDMPHFQSAV